MKLNNTYNIGKKNNSLASKKNIIWISLLALSIIHQTQAHTVEAIEAPTQQKADNFHHIFYETIEQKVEYWCRRSQSKNAFLRYFNSKLHQWLDEINSDHRNMAIYKYHGYEWTTQDTQYKYLIKKYDKITWEDKGIIKINVHDYIDHFQEKCE
jgi:hypothetical protein